MPHYDNLSTEDTLNNVLFEGAWLRGYVVPFAVYDDTIISDLAEPRFVHVKDVFKKLYYNSLKSTTPENYDLVALVYAAIIQGYSVETSHNDSSPAFVVDKFSIQGETLYTLIDMFDSYMARTYCCRHLSETIAKATVVFFNSIATALIDDTTFSTLILLDAVIELFEKAYLQTLIVTGGNNSTYLDLLNKYYLFDPTNEFSVCPSLDQCC